MPDTLRRLPNLPLPTWGGKQLWCDWTIYGGWRIQRQIWTGHYRLLDAADIRRAYGTLAACAAALDRARSRGAAAIASPRLCLLLHGLGRSKDSMRRLRDAIANAGYEAYAVNYPSTRCGIGAHAESIAGLLRRLAPEFSEVVLVTHSLGGIVARVLCTLPEIPPIRHVVMIAPPNLGSAFADHICRNALVRVMLGPAVADIQQPQRLLDQFPCPSCPVGIIAGTRGWNPLLAGQHDGVVPVDVTMLAGATDHVLVHRTHTFIMNAPEVIDLTVRFLQTQRFT